MKQLSIIGNIGKIETKYTNTGKMVCEFSIAVNEGKGENKTTEWFKAVAWEKAAEVLSEYAKVGSKIFVSGNPKIEAWVGKDGEARAQNVVTVREFEFLGDKKEKQSTPFDRPSDGDGWDGDVQE